MTTSGRVVHDVEHHRKQVRIPDRTSLVELGARLDLVIFNIDFYKYDKTIDGLAPVILIFIS